MAVALVQRGWAAHSEGLAGVLRLRISGGGHRPRLGGRVRWRASGHQTCRLFWLFSWSHRRVTLRAQHCSLNFCSARTHCLPLVWSGQRHRNSIADLFELSA